ncbi:MAG: DNA/RNA nuclease SfsA [Bacillota bacterium]
MGESLAIALTGLQQGTIIYRPNRFVAVVRLGDQEFLAHVADSGRLKELLFPGNQVMVRKAGRAGAPATVPADCSQRKTPYDLVLASARTAASSNTAVHDRSGKPIWVSVDTRYPNQIFGQALRARAICEVDGGGEVRSEYWYHHLSPWKEEVEREALQGAAVSRAVRSRMDFFLGGVPGASPGLVEVKSVTLCREGIGFFPDATTDRGTRHLRELMRGVKEGYRAYAVFIAQREDIGVVKPNREMDPAFADALKEAQDSGVRLLGFRCSVTPTEIRLDPRAIPVDARADR